MDLLGDSFMFIFLFIYLSGFGILFLRDAAGALAKNPQQEPSGANALWRIAIATLFFMVPLGLLLFRYSDVTDVALSTWVRIAFAATLAMTIVIVTAYLLYRLAKWWAKNAPTIRTLT
jgi:hypothetical protein